jgi:hypothetical protein
VALLANGHTTQALEEHLNLMQNPALQAHKRLAFEQEEIFKGLQ